MVIVIVGGPDRVVSAMRSLAARHGHLIEHHDGTSSPSRKQALDAMIARADLVVIVTGVNSHAAVIQARALVKRHDVPSLISRRFGVAHLRRLCTALARREGSVGPRRRAAASLAASPVGLVYSRGPGPSSTTRSDLSAGMPAPIHQTN